MEEGDSEGFCTFVCSSLLWKGLEVSEEKSYYVEFRGFVPTVPKRSLLLHIVT